jgi:hypothetical protein
MDLTLKFSPAQPSATPTCSPRPGETAST